MQKGRKGIEHDREILKKNRNKGGQRHLQPGLSKWQGRLEDGGHEDRGKHEGVPVCLSYLGEKYEKIGSGGTRKDRIK